VADMAEISRPTQNLDVLRTRWRNCSEEYEAKEKDKRYAAAAKRAAGRRAFATIRKMHDPNAADRPITFCRE
jgi:hypothetical protein